MRVTINTSSFMLPAGGSGGRTAAAAACDYTVEGKKRRRTRRDECVAPRCVTATRGHTPPGQGVKYKLTA